MNLTPDDMPKICAKSDEEIEHLRSNSEAWARMHELIHAAVNNNNWHRLSVIDEVTEKSPYLRRTVETLVEEYFDLDKKDNIGGDSGKSHN